MTTLTPAALASGIGRDEIVGIDEPSPVLGGPPVPYVNLDNAATTPPLRSVLDAVADFLPSYSSVHPRHRPQVEAQHRRLRAGTRRRGPVRGRRSRAGHGDLRTAHDRRHQPAGSVDHPRARRRRSHHDARAPLQRPSMASPGRCSLGGYSDTSDVDRAVDALEHVAGGSVRYAYTRRPDGEWVADR